MQREVKGSRKDKDKERDKIPLYQEYPLHLFTLFLSGQNMLVPAISYKFICCLFLFSSFFFLFLSWFYHMSPSYWPFYSSFIYAGYGLFLMYCLCIDK